MPKERSKIIDINLQMIKNNIQLLTEIPETHCFLAPPAGAIVHKTLFNSNKK